MKDAYSLIRQFIAENEVTSVTAEGMCKRFNLKMSEVRKVYMRLNREGILSHKRHSSRYCHDDEWTPNWYAVYREKLFQETTETDKAVKSLYFKVAILTGEESACKKKIRYKDFENAKMAASSVNQRTHKSGFEPYLCPFCNGWHIGEEINQKEFEKYARGG